MVAWNLFYVSKCYFAWQLARERERERTACKARAVLWPKDQWPVVEVGGLATGHTYHRCKRDKERGKWREIKVKLHSWKVFNVAKWSSSISGHGIWARIVWRARRSKWGHFILVMAGHVKRVLLLPAPTASSCDFMCPACHTTWHITVNGFTGFNGTN